jgi:predicted transcriptional regulator
MPGEKPVSRALPPDDTEAEEPVHLVERIEEELDLLARNVDILEKLASSPPIGIIRLSEALRLPIHKTRYSLHLLEREGVIQPSADGAVITDKSMEFWANLSESLARMNAIIEHLKSRAVEHENRPPPSRKGY